MIKSLALFYLANTACGIDMVNFFPPDMRKDIVARHELFIKDANDDIDRFNKFLCYKNSEYSTPCSSFPHDARPSILNPTSLNESANTQYHFEIPSGYEKNQFIQEKRQELYKHFKNMVNIIRYSVDFLNCDAFTDENRRKEIGRIVRYIYSIFSSGVIKNLFKNKEIESIAQFIVTLTSDNKVIVKATSRFYKSWDDYLSAVLSSNNTKFILGGLDNKRCGNQTELEKVTIHFSHGSNEDKALRIPEKLFEDIEYLAIFKAILPYVLGAKDLFNEIQENGDMKCIPVLPQLPPEWRLLTYPSDSEVSDLEFLSNIMPFEFILEQTNNEGVEPVNTFTTISSFDNVSALKKKNSRSPSIDSLSGFSGASTDVSFNSQTSSRSSLTSLDQGASAEYSSECEAITSSHFEAFNQKRIDQTAIEKIHKSFSKLVAVAKESHIPKLILGTPLYPGSMLKKVTYGAQRIIYTYDNEGKHLEYTVNPKNPEESKNRRGKGSSFFIDNFSDFLPYLSIDECHNSGNGVAKAKEINEHKHDESTHNGNGHANKPSVPSAYHIDLKKRESKCSYAHVNKELSQH